MNKFVNLVEKANRKESGFHTNIEKETISNKNFRKVLFTASNIQLVAMSLKPNEDIGEETHPNTDQFIRVDQGNGTALIGNKTYKLKDGDCIIVPKGSKHNVTASKEGMKLYTVYSPPHHPDGKIDEVKPETDED